MRSLGASAAALALCALAMGIAPLEAGAAIAPATVLGGPSATILDVDGAAMAPDGSGGVVFRELVEGEPHVFVSRFVNGVWEAPIRVDYGQAGPAETPTIAAADGGELLVVWVQPWTWMSASPGAQASLHYGLMSAVLQAGAQTFGQIERIDDVGDGTAAYPSLSMAPDGTAYVAYRVVDNPLISRTMLPVQPMRPGDELIDVRVARFNGLSWATMGAVNRLPGQATMRRATAVNAPVVAVNNAGQALVVWQEPDIEGVARIWARRLFGTTKGNVLAVSPTTIGGAAVTVDADAPAVALNEYGEAEVAMRLGGGSGSPLGSPEILLNTLTMPVTEEVSAFTGSVPLDGGASVGAPSLAIDSQGDYRLGYTVDGSDRVIVGKDATHGSPSVLGQAKGGSSRVTVDPGGGGMSAWGAVDSSGRPVVEVRQQLGSGAWQMGYLSAPVSGPVEGPVTGGSGLGDALVAFRQGPPADAQVVATLVQSPPGGFIVHVPAGWVKGRTASVSWEASANAVSSVSYSVLVDGRVIAHGLGGRSLKLASSNLGDGIRHVQVLATDLLGQETMSSQATLRVDSDGPLVSVTRKGDRVEVHVYDRASGVKTADTVVSFGDGTQVTRHAKTSHLYKRAGRYTVIVHAEDKVGNRRYAQVLVQIP